MSNIKRIFIEMDDLTDAQQLDLWKTLWKFADEKLEANKDLMVFVISKKTPQNKQKFVKEANAK